MVFDSLGRTVEQYNPVTEPIGQAGVFNAANDEAYHTTTEFDVLDRTVKTTLPDHTVTTMAYGFGFGRDRDGRNPFYCIGSFKTHLPFRLTSCHSLEARVGRTRKRGQHDIHARPPHRHR